MTRALIIAHVMGYYMPDLGYQENYLPFCQSKLGHQVHIVTSDRYAPHPQYEEVYGMRLGARVRGPSTSSADGVTVHRLPVIYENVRHQNPVLKGTVRLLADIKADIVHLHGVTPASTLSVLLSDAHRRHTLVCDHHLCGFNMLPYSPAKRLYYSVFRNVVLPPLKQRVKMWLPINEDAEGVLAKELGISGRNVEISRLGVDTTSFRFDPERGRVWRERFSIPGDAPLVVHAGKLEPRKEVHSLIEAFMSGPIPTDVRLVIVGSGPPDYLARLKELSDSQSGRIVLLPMLRHDELPSLYSAADLAIWPGDSSITALEALGCGVHVIIADPPGAVYAAGAPGLSTIPLGDRKALLAALQGVRISAPFDRSWTSEFISRTMSWKAIARKTIDQYTRAKD